jgi:AcrR family transcriptional regulator
MASDTRDTILQVARRLFVRQGYTATSTRQIALDAEIGKATVYHHFRNKRAIVLALMEQNIEGTRPALEAVRAESDPCRRIQMIVEGNLRFYFDAGDILQIIQREVRDGVAKVQTEYRACQRELSILIEETLKQGSEQGVFRSIDPAEGARLLMVMIEGTNALTSLGGEQPQQPEKAAAMLLEAFFRVIKE